MLTVCCAILSVAIVFTQPIASNHPDFDHVFKQILEQDEHARIFLLGRSVRNRWRDQLATRIYANIGTALANDRIYFLNDVDTKQRLLLAGAADVVMANIHLTSQLSTIQAFAAGVPVVTMPGELWGSRIAYALYMQMGMTDLIAKSLDEYAVLALRLACDPQFRSEMVTKVQERRGRLNEDPNAVEGWETFLDQAGSEIFPSADADEDADDYDDNAAEVVGIASTNDSSHGELRAGIHTKKSNSSSGNDNSKGIASHPTLTNDTLLQNAENNVSTSRNDTPLQDAETNNDKGDKVDTDGEERANTIDDRDNEVASDDKIDTEREKKTRNVDADSDNNDEETGGDTDDKDTVGGNSKVDGNDDDDDDGADEVIGKINGGGDRREDQAEDDEELERDEL